MGKYKILTRYGKNESNKKILFFEISAVTLDELDLIRHKIKEEVQFDKIKKIYFEPKSEFPKYKLREFTDKKKVNSPDKADCIVFNKSYFKGFCFSKYKYSIRDLDTGDTILISEDYLLNPTVRNIIGCEVTAENILRILIEEKTVSPNSKIFGEMAISRMYDSPSVAEFYNEKIIISDKQLSDFVNENLVEFDEERFNTIKHMLSSRDSDSISLAIDTLSNMNSKRDPFKIIYLIKKYSSTILNSKRSKSVGFKNLIKSLGFTPTSSIVDICNIIHFLPYFKIFELIDDLDCNKICDKDIEFAKRMFENEIIDAMASKNLFDNKILNVLSVDIEIKINQKTKDNKTSFNIF